MLQRLVLGALNVQSANNKIDEIMDIGRDHALDVMLLSETWPGGDSVSIRRLRAEGLQVLERARSRARPASLHVNHGGVAVAAVPGVRMSAVSLLGGQRILTFEHLCARLVVRGSAYNTVLLVYRPGSVAVESLFFDELSSLLDELATRSEPVIVAGDFNIRLDRPDDLHSRHLLEILSAHGLHCHVTSQSLTHDRGAIIDIVATRAHLAAPDVSVLEAGISDHRLLRWTCHLERPPPVYYTSTHRPWRRVMSTSSRLIFVSRRYPSTPPQTAIEQATMTLTLTFSPTNTAV